MARMKNKRLLFAAIAGVTSIVILVVVLLLSGSPEERVVFDQSHPGAARTGYIHTDTEMVDRLEASTSKLLLTDLGYRSWQRIAGLLTGQTAELSSAYLTADQLAAAWIHLEQGNKEALLSDLVRIRTRYITGQGLPASQISIDAEGRIIRPDTFSTRASLSWLRLLAESYSLTGSEDLLTELRAASDALLSRTGSDGLLPPDSSMAILADSPRSDPAATPTIRPSVTPTPVIAEERAVIRLADIDLYALKLLIPLDPRWQKVFDRQKSILADAVQSDELPLFAYAYDPAADAMIGFSGSQPLVAMEDVLLTLLHVFEAGEPRQDVLSDIRSRFYEDSAVFEQIHRATGVRSNDSECIIGYACLARIARIVDDPFLYEKAVSRLAWHIATSTRSAAYGAVFRTDPDDRIRVSAADNLAARLAFR